MSDLSSERTPLLIAAEINTIKNQTGRIVLTNALEIGRRLKEAKALIKHGEWGKWLEESVSYSQRSADCLMQLLEEYGANLLASPDCGDNPNSQALANLTYTQALILLGVPAEEREKFIAEHDVENMSSRELQQIVKQRDEALEGKKQALAEKDQTLRKMGELQVGLDSIVSNISELNNTAKLLEQQTGDNQPNEQITPEHIGAESKQIELKAAKDEEKFKQKMAARDEQLKAEQAKSPVLTPAEQFKFHRENLIHSYEELLKLLHSLAKRDPEKKEKYRQIIFTIAENMVKTLKVYPPEFQVRDI